MKKIILLLTVVAAFVIQGCEGPEGPQGPVGPPGDTISAVYEFQNVSFSYNSTDGYVFYRQIPGMYQSDVMLIYRMNGTVNSTTPIWQQIPRTLYLPQGELDYDFDFTRTDFNIYAGGNYDLSLTPAYLTNQTFRVVIVPGYFANKGGKSVDYSDYNAVIKAYNIDDSKVKVLR
ncbi:hypothetical protein [Flavobacterium sp. WV_118_3]|uniref:hypothetical protein n=1 Tax=Flavobacterium sp. WV_118_3 TaxID=3151764 RepID=UPI0012C1FB94|nr:hypothetical protein [Flavobacterium sp.]HRB70447.1 hypothetical protein [Flavobacterium sp.]